MKVLHIISDSNIGGAGILLTTLLKHMDTRRIQSAVALPRGSLLQERIQGLNVPVYPLIAPCDRISSSSIAEIKRIITRFGADLVHTNGAISGRIAGRRSGIPVLYTRHCCYPTPLYLKIPPLSWGIGAWNRHYADCVIATAQAAAENVKDYGIRAENIRTVINGGERVRSVSEQEKVQTRQRWKIPPDAIVIGIAARLEPCKGHLIFLQAAKELKAFLPQQRFCFLVAGSGSMEDTLKQEAKRLQIARDVRFLGFLSDMAPFYSLLHLHVNCSMGTETSCLALSEAMSASVPCIVSDYGGNPSMVGDDGAGLVYPAGDSHALAEAICTALADTSKYQQMRRLALARYENHYTATRMAEQMMAIYEMIYTDRR